VIVHTGEGRAFQTGVDVTEIASDGLGMQRYRQSVEDNDFHFTAWHQHVWKPVITAVNGICAGGGFHWIADADIVIAASDAQFFDPHVSIGQVVAMEAIGLLRKMPSEAVMRMALVGRYERVSAQRAYELGFVNHVVAAGEVMAKARELAGDILAGSPLFMRAVKELVAMSVEVGQTEARSVDHLSEIASSPGS
jgi:enoyl-CoA hydratase